MEEANKKREDVKSLINMMADLCMNAITAESQSLWESICINYKKIWWLTVYFHYINHFLLNNFY